MTMDTGEQIGSQDENNITVTMFDDKGNTWVESQYDGYGVFGGKDYYDLTAEMNGWNKDNFKDFTVEKGWGSNDKPHELRTVGIMMSSQIQEKYAPKGTYKFPGLMEYYDAEDRQDHDFSIEAEQDPNQSWYIDEEGDVFPYAKGGKVKVQHYGNTLHDFDVKNKNEAEDRINKLLNRYNKKRNKTSNYAIYYEDENGKITSWQKYAKGGKVSEKDKFWDENYKELIKVVGNNPDYFRDYLLDIGLTQDDVDAEMDGTSKHIALTVLYMSDIETLNGFLDMDEDEEEDYAKGGKVKKRMWLAKEGKEEFVLEAPNKKKAEEDASMYGGYIVREIKNFKKNPDGSVEYAKGGEIKRFDRHESMPEEIRDEISYLLNGRSEDFHPYRIIDTGLRAAKYNEYWDRKQNNELKNYLFGLYDGYNYSHTKDFKKVLSNLKKSDIKTGNRVEKLFNEVDKYPQGENAYEYAKGGDIDKGYSYDIEYEDDEGDEYSESFNTLQEAREEIKSLKNSDMHDYTIKRKYRYKDGEYLGSFERGGETEKFDKSGKCIGYVKSKYDSLCANCGSNKSSHSYAKGGFIEENKEFDHKNEKADIGYTKGSIGISDSEWNKIPKSLKSRLQYNAYSRAELSHKRKNEEKGGKKGNSDLVIGGIVGLLVGLFFGGNKI
tara:strand:- start:760 stop:2745 length:1986 start_codon:yes stop_codon:yes gene_type:complete